MIAEAVDTALTLGWALAAWIGVLALAVTLLLLGVAGAVWWACTWLYGRLRPELPAKARRLPDTREMPAQSRLWLRSARVARPAPTTTAPSRPQGSRWSALRGAGGGFPAPSPASRSQSRSRPSWANTQPINHEEAA